VWLQEWAPLLPVLHRPSFLRIYEEYLADPEAGHWHSNKLAVAQLFLIFEIAALSSVVSKLEATTYCTCSYTLVTYQAEHYIIRAAVAKSSTIFLFDDVYRHSSMPCACATLLFAQG
jgi:hypothetical protein